MSRRRGEPGGDTMKQTAPIGPAPVGSVGYLVHAIGGRQCHKAILPRCGTCRRRAPLLFIPAVSRRTVHGLSYERYRPLPASGEMQDG